VVRRGDEVLDGTPGNSELFGARQVIQAAVDIEAVGLLDTFPGCGAPVPHASYESLRDELIARLRDALPLDGVLLVLHGAMATDAEDDIEADLVRAVRGVVGPGVPVVASMDLHAAVSENTAELLDGLVGFKTCPHTDYVETGQSAAQLLLDTVRGNVHPGVLLRAIPMITAAEAHDTKIGPLAPHMTRAQSLVDGLDVLDVSIFAAQPWLDTARTRWTVTVTYNPDTADGYARASAVADDVVAQLTADVDAFAVSKARPESAWQEILAFAEGPVLVADSGDSPSAGADGTSMDCLSHLIGRGLPSVLASLTDPQLARLASMSHPGDRIAGGPLAETVEVVSTSTGRFDRTYPAGPVDVGACAVVRVANATVVVTEQAAMMVDTSLFDHVGIDPSQFDVVQVKSAGGFRALWGPISDRIVVVDSLGASTSRLSELPFTKVDRSMWPFATIHSSQIGASR
jgi:microcystin degradation protein MlrC